MAVRSSLAKCFTSRYCGPLQKSTVVSTVVRSIIYNVAHGTRSRLESVRIFSNRSRSNDRYMSASDRLLNSRSLLRNALPTELIRAVGVSFQHRQEAVAQLQPGQPVCFVQEPDNPVDPHAVAITSLSDVPLGYVPKGCTAPFIHRVCFGVVRSVGQAENSMMYGFTAEVQPRLPPVTVLALPREVEDVCIRLVDTLSGPAWDALKTEVIVGMKRQCSLSTVPTESVVARWEVKDNDGIVRLLGLALQAPELTKIEHMLAAGDFNDLGSNVWPHERAAVDMLCSLNGWNSFSDGVTYLKRRQILQQERSRPIHSAGWSLDLSYLVERGVDLPSEAARYTR